MAACTQAVGDIEYRQPYLGEIMRVSGRGQRDSKGRRRVRAIPVRPATSAPKLEKNRHPARNSLTLHL